MIDTSSILFTANRPDIVMKTGVGMHLWDTEGRMYLDFLGGWAVTCLGHCPEVMQEVLKSQSAQLINASPAFFNEPMLSFASLLTKISGFDKVFFGSSGAEANESAVKLARKYGTLKKKGAFRVLTTVNSFHGRTLAMMAATGKEHWKTLFTPRVEGFEHVPFNDLAAMRRALTPDVCAIMLEPIQGEGGVMPAEREWLQGLRDLCDETGTLLIFDEIQTGIGRTGRMFCYEHFGVRPDIMTLAKGLGGGYPISAMLTTEALDLFEPGDQGGSYCAQPLGMAVGEAVIREILSVGWVQNADDMGVYLRDQLEELKCFLGLNESGIPFIDNIRGMGLLVAFDLSGPYAASVVLQALQEGLLINAPQPATIRLMPPLIVRPNDIDDMICILKKIMMNEC